jgi:hypothetical protein
MYLPDPSRQDLLDRLRRQAEDPHRRILLTGAAVVSMAPCPRETS